MRSWSSRASPNPVWLVSYWKMALWDRRTGRTPCADEDRERSAAGSGKDFQQPTRSYRQARKDSVTAQCCRQLSFELLNSGVGRQQISVVLGPPFVLLCCSSPGKLIQAIVQLKWDRRWKTSWKLKCLQWLVNILLFSVSHDSKGSVDLPASLPLTLQG